MEDAPVIAWILPEHLGLVMDACRIAGLSLVAVGTPARGETRALADRAGAEPMPDLRAALASTEARVALLTVCPDPVPDARVVLAAESRGLRIASLGPFASGAIDAAEHGFLREQAGMRPADSIRLVPRPRAHPVFRAAEDVLGSFGDIELVLVESHAPRSNGGLPAALLSAIDLVHTLIGTPELIDAASPGGARHIGAMEGYLAALLRFPDGRFGQIAASDRAAWGWRATLTGRGGRLTLRPSGFDWFDDEGRRRDEHRAAEGSRDPVRVFADALRLLLDPGAPRGPAPAWAEILASAEASLLSTRTGQAESPWTLLRAAQSAD
ncbi:MAG TPA: hypothetical protein ENK11_03185 [Phycisphaerales bacterium]|nr:hypothetical protein [Phycisphaerales bacterium]